MNEPERLERLWQGDFGDQYTNRNSSSFNLRKPFWQNLARKYRFQRVLEVGCNAGGNLKWLSPLTKTYGVDINEMALRLGKVAYPDLNMIQGVARDLPFKDGFFDLTYTCGVLIHQPKESLREVMAELVRTSSRYVLCMEYYAAKRELIQYRKQESALFKDDFGGIYQRKFKLRLMETGKLGFGEGFDDITWWLLRKR